MCIWDACVLETAVVVTGVLAIGAAIYAIQRNRELMASHNSSHRPPPRRDGRHWSTNEPDIEPPNNPDPRNGAGVTLVLGMATFGLTQSTNPSAN